MPLTIVLLLSAEEAAGLACVVCGERFEAVANVQVGRSTLGAPVYACTAPCAHWYRSAAVGPTSTGSEC
ncbi:hypothetical protein [Streptantibioticus ferralitis]|uniref:Uncharacterized protein n=1 Tax=Streptantibioticus ferralitis TaxID=236510 RepID=A0ABT5Z9M9_9ACTN|nr:hypothetical protein [Streptantibioticus ferralitis]MDF2260542.1 hypothetical protein [Streptantibioticus ferralitis]